ncbi:MAG: VanZ family protein [Rubrivivax sp.]|nr:VanZ family protein [Rubrivivax sp.]
MDRQVAGLLLAYLAFIVYGSLAPLNWEAQPLSQAWQAFLALEGPRWRGYSRVDIAVNTLLLVPLSFGLAYAVAHAGLGTGARWLGWFLIWPLVACLSVAVEFSQVFFPPRDPSWTDVVAQWTGSALGLLLYAAFGARVRRQHLGISQARGLGERSHRWLGIYLFLLLAYNLMPLDLTVSPVELYRKWRDGRVLLLPFVNASPADPQWWYELFSDVALWVPVGLMWCLDGRQRSLGQVLRLGLLCAAALEVAQLFVLSRVTDSTDVLLAGVGVVLGAAALPWLRRMRAADPARQALVMQLAFGVWVLTATVALWLPFNFSFDGFGMASVVEATTRVPFRTYLFRGEFAALSEILRKLLVFLPGGLLLGAWTVHQRAGRPWRWLLPAFVLALVLEAGQLLLPGKVPDLTDALLGCLGAWFGWRLARAGSGMLKAADPVDHSKVLAPSPARRERELVHGYLPQALLVAGLAVALWLLSRLPGVPYNVAKLMPAGGAGVAAAIGLALVAWWMLAVPLGMFDSVLAGTAKAAGAGRRRRLLWPALLLGHAVISFAVLRAAVPLQMLHKVVGTPVLGLGGPWEDLVRYVALHLCILLPLLGGALLVRTLLRPATLPDLLLWGFVAAFLFWPLHWVVVDQAGTDNLVELMQGGGSLGSSLALATGWLLVATAGSALAAACMAAGLARARRWQLLALAGVSLALAPVLYGAGLEDLLLKYERGFSALQFIVSANRDAYATGPELAARAAAVLLLQVLSVAMLQAWHWHRPGPAAPGPKQPPRITGSARDFSGPVS